MLTLRIAPFTCKDKHEIQLALRSIAIAIGEGAVKGSNPEFSISASYTLGPGEFMHLGLKFKPYRKLTNAEKAVPLPELVQRLRSIGIHSDDNRRKGGITYQWNYEAFQRATQIAGCANDCDLFWVELTQGPV